MLEGGQFFQESGTQPGEVPGDGQTWGPKAQGAMEIQGTSLITTPI